MSEPLSEQIAAFREAIVSWRHGVTLEPQAIEAFDELFEGWQRAAQQLEGEPFELADEIDEAAGICADIVDELKALGDLTRKINAYTVRLKAQPNLHLKGV